MKRFIVVFLMLFAVSSNAAVLVQNDSGSYTASYATPQAACTATGVKRIEITSPYTISTGFTCGADRTLEIKKGGLLTIASGQTLTINNFPDPGPVQVFAGAGTVTFGGGSVDKILFHWFGGLDNASAATNTAALLAAINSVKSIGYTAEEKPAIYISAGRYAFTEIPVASLQGLTIVGAEGSKGTYLEYTGTGTFFELSPFDSTPVTLYSGTTTGTTFKNLIIRNNAETNIALTGTRVATAIQNNGSSRITLDNVQILGFKYGYAATTGGYLSHIKDSVFQLNDAGVYLGPGSQLSKITDCRFITNGEGVVNEMASVLDITGGDFEDNQISDVTIQGRDTTRLGISTASGKTYEYNLNMRNCWHETGNWATGWNPQQHIHLDGDTNNPVRNINVSNPHIISGTAGMAAKTGGVTYSFIRSNNATMLSLVLPVIANGRLDAFIYQQTEGLSFIDRSREVNGYNAILQYDGLINSSTAVKWGAKTEASFITYHQDFIDRVTGDQIRITPKTDGVIGFSYNTAGTWFERVTFDMPNSAITLDATTIMTGANTPEGAKTAAVGSLFLRTNGGANTTLYIKESGTGNTGWVAK